MGYVLLGGLEEGGILLFRVGSRNRGEENGSDVCVVVLDEDREMRKI